MIDVEHHELELRYAELRVADPSRRSRLLASLAERGQQSPVLVVVTADEAHRFVLIDGYARVEALVQLGRDFVRAVILEIPEPEALIFAHRLEVGRRHSALEEGWLIAELLTRHGMTQQQVAVRLNRSVSWVSRRLALVDALSTPVQSAVKRGLIPAQAAMKFLVPLSRANELHCDTLVAGLADNRITVRQVERLYRGWRLADEEGRARIVEHPWLYLKTEAATRAPDVPVGDPAAPLLKDLEGIAGLSRRARRRIREGVLEELDEGRRALVDRAIREAHLIFDTVSALLRTPCSTATSVPRS